MHTALCLPQGATRGFSLYYTTAHTCIHPLNPRVGDHAPHLTQQGKSSLPKGRQFQAQDTIIALSLLLLHKGAKSRRGRDRPRLVGRPLFLQLVHVRILVGLGGQLQGAGARKPLFVALDLSRPTPSVSVRSALRAQNAGMETRSRRRYPGTTAQTSPRTRAMGPRRRALQARRRLAPRAGGVGGSPTTECRPKSAVASPFDCRCWRWNAATTCIAEGAGVRRSARSLEAPSGALVAEPRMGANQLAMAQAVNQLTTSGVARERQGVAGSRTLRRPKLTLNGPGARKQLVGRTGSGERRSENEFCRVAEGLWKGDGCSSSRPSPMAPLFGSTRYSGQPLVSPAPVSGPS
jgi:hypothetical protein